MRGEAPIRDVRARAYTIPTDRPESDGTLQWSSTGLVVVEVAAGDEKGLGYTYGPPAVASVVSAALAPVLDDMEALDVPAAWTAMIGRIRNMGRPGLASMAVAACDIALHDLKARLLDLPLCRLLGQVRPRVPVYGSGGFTSYSDAELAAQMGGWADQGLKAAKMKVGREPGRDAARVRVARDAAPGVELMVDANGAYSQKQAVLLAQDFAALGVDWFEEPVSSDDRAGLGLLRQAVPPGMEITAGEYGYDLPYFRDMAAAVDVLQADATRCAGFSGFLMVDALAHAHQLPLSSHTAPAAHLHVACASLRLRHMEWFHDHVRIEHMLFDGAPDPRDGAVTPDLSRPGHGLRLREDAAERYAA
jgi:L-alanine-DL-glutamate epimerase-like enolase superfamily enzyme